MKKFEELGCAPAPWTAEANALGDMVLTCHDTDADGKPWSEDFAQAWGATASSSTRTAPRSSEDLSAKSTSTIMKSDAIGIASDTGKKRRSRNEEH